MLVVVKLIRNVSLILILSIGCISLSIAQTNIEKLSTSKKIRKQLDKWPFDFSTSLELKYGHRTSSPPHDHNSTILGESRWQLDGAYYADWSELKTKVDVGYDAVLGDLLVDVREMNIDLYPQSWWSTKIGRQALTWGKGDLLFINDLFPKDFQSFFSGRDIQYLKAPSDALKLTFTPSWLQINIVYTPQFDPDRYPTGERIVFFDQAFQTYRVEDNILPVAVPDDFFKDDELAWRLQKNVKGVDLALYGYYGFWKGPTELQTAGKLFTFPSLQVHGLSVESSILGGIVALEMGYYKSSDDIDGSDPLIRNSEYRWLINYSRDFKGSFTVALQYYSEIMADYDEYKTTFPGGELLPHVRDMLTLRLRKLTNRQRLELSLVTFYGIADNDIYLRPRVSYKLNDYWKVDVGANIFTGENDLTFWNQFNFNTNIYLGLKWAI